MLRKVTATSGDIDFQATAKKGKYEQQKKSNLSSLVCDQSQQK